MKRFVSCAAALVAVLGAAPLAAQPATPSAAQPAASSVAQPAASAAVPLADPDEIVVTADFRALRAADLPLPVTVLDAAALDVRRVQHFEELIPHVPNLNLSGEGARARYFQLRGIGELEQYDGAPNPSVGFVIDDVDFSGLGSIGTLFDVDRVEVLRGPQGTRYGANALGGLIYMRSSAPPPELAADFEATTGNDSTLAIGAAVGGPLGDELGYRASLHAYRSDGFRHNAYLGRDDTYGRDELAARGKLAWVPTERVSVDFAGFYVDVDNGYDAWAVDNGFTMYSDKPGKDAQRSAAGSVRVEAKLAHVDLVSISGAAETDATYSFDADWGNPDFWAPYVYDFTQTNDRRRRTFNQELRLLSKPGAIADGRGDWLAGVYLLDLEESNDRVDYGLDDYAVYCDPCLAATDYDATNVALFGQVGLELTSRAHLTVGLRSEVRDADYTDSLGNRFAPRDRMTGGELALTWRVDDAWSTYVRLARGYKAGGFNTSFAGVDFDEVDGVTADQIEYRPESLLSLEAGLKGAWRGGALRGELGVFAARRDDQQIKIPMQLVLGDPASFLFLTANAERGTHRGVEATVSWDATDRLTFDAAVGALDAEIETFSLFPDLVGREPPHAPDYTFAFGAEYRAPSGWWGRLDVTGMDAFYFDYGHDQRSQGYTVTNLRVGREWGPWSVAVWARNLLDEEYAVRGFFFGNEPPDFPAKLYTRLGDPRHAGITMKYRW